MRAPIVLERDNFLGIRTSYINTPLLDELVIGPSRSLGDLEAASLLLELLIHQYGLRATEMGMWVSNEEIRLATEACVEVVARLPIAPLELPFYDYESFYAHCTKIGATGSGSWQARREVVSSSFEPTKAAVRQEEIRRRRSTVATSVSPDEEVGWPAIEGLLDEVAKRFSAATSELDFQAVGLLCVRVLETLSRTLYNPEIHVDAQNPFIPADKSKDRLSRVVQVARPGSGKAELRSLVNAAISFAHKVKHSDHSTREDAGIAADATKLVCHLLSRLLGPNASH